MKSLYENLSLSSIIIHKIMSKEDVIIGFSVSNPSYLYKRRICWRAGLLTENAINFLAFPDVPGTLLKLPGNIQAMKSSDNQQPPAHHQNESAQRGKETKRLDGDKALDKNRALKENGADE